MVLKQKEIDTWQEKLPLLKRIIDLDPVVWLNDDRRKMSVMPTMPLKMQDIKEAEQLWHRFAPFLMKAFPETNGVIESPVQKGQNLKSELDNYFSSAVDGELYLKCDNELPIAGSIKARGGIYEVLHHAESLAIDAGLITKQDNYERFASNRFKAFFKNYSIGVGSTGNLGLSIGIISAALGFSVTVYMSRDAKQWKKDLLRKKGVTVQEFAGDFSEAIYAGRLKTNENPKGYFVDDEDSKHLFLGYSVAAIRLQKQLEEQKIQIDENHPLFVYLPCGVGGSPGGITFGLKQVFGDHVHCFFVEPTHSPSVLIGLLTGEMERISVQDFGIDNHTEADGLAVGRPSRFATGISKHLLSGIYTVRDEQLFKILALLYDNEKIYVEPSAAAGIIGPWNVMHSNYLKQSNIHTENITHIAWLTGGGLVPEAEMKQFYGKGKRLIKKEGE
ncbi:D-serine ammonia-lyase [Virgibacillus oceani]|uniref:Probable D-serine dehydratase n=1 Tax=Virgibacillus oceani TaxID=1479511 RepID=A0A917M575_9BACI|nr:D-serine ammonia-lyase [Virgibacillus oceani]GGG77701.1 putative D-serine dehydratase [Virgibacillus oceani]